MQLGYERPVVEYGRADARASKSGIGVDPRLAEARTEPDLEKRVAKLEPLASDATASLARAARVDLVHTLAKLGRIEAMERAAKELEIADDLEGAELLATMSLALSDFDGDRDRALVLARRAFEIIEWIRGAGPLPGQVRGPWKRDLARRKARYRDAVGWALTMGGDAHAGASYCANAADVLPDDTRVHWHFGYALEQAGKRDAAISAYAKAVAGSEADSPRALERLRALTPDSAAEVEAATAALVERIRRRMPRAFDEPAPPLTSVEVKGPAVVVFWASWDEESVQALRNLATLEGIRIVAVSTDPVAANGKAAASRIGVPFPVGVDPEGADSRAWRVRGLPTSVVLDARGRVRYRNEGMAPGYQWVLKAQAESLGDKT